MLTFQIRNPMLIDVNPLLKNHDKNFDIKSISHSRSVEELDLFIQEMISIFDILPSDINERYEIQSAITNNIAIANFWMERYGFALSYIEESLQYIKKCVEALKFAKLVYMNTGIIRHELCKFEQAHSMFSESEKFFSEDESDLSFRINLYNCLGNIYFSESKFKEARQNLEKALELCSQKKDLDNSFPLMSYNNLAICLDGQGDFQQASDLMINCQIILEKSQGQMLYEKCIINHNTSAFFYNLGVYESFLALRKAAEEIYRQIQRPQNFKLHANYLNNIGFFKMNTGDKRDERDGREMIEKALQIYLEKYSEDHLEIAMIRNNLSLVLCNLELYSKAEEELRKAQDVIEKFFNQEHIELAKVYHSIGFLHDYQDDEEQAIEYYHKSLSLYQKLFQDEHPHLSVIYNNIGCSYSGMGNKIEAAQFYKKSLDHSSSKLKGRDIEIARTLRNLGKAIKHKEIFEETFRLFQKSRLAFFSNFGKLHPDVNYLNQNIDIITKDLAINNINQIEL